ncbi:MAG: cyanophycinase [Clostridia bacterium]|jgi:cyanophycinase|nr:cyanophycinase [Clostridia bacterium]
MTDAKDFKLVIIGGGEDKKADKKILKEVVKLAGGKEARIGIVTTATKLPEEVGQEYEKLFKDMGVSEVNTINIGGRKTSDIHGTIDKIMDYSCLFFSGGDQLRISSIIGGTDFHNLIHDYRREGRIIAGTSAGASMMSQIMIVEGDDEEAPARCTIKLAPGMGLIDGVVIDQHFNQRGRIGRLFAAVAQNPSILGIGIDEDTAIVVEGNEKFSVIGNGVVTVVDGRHIEYTNITEQYPDDPLALTNVTVHILPERYGYNLIDKTAIIISEKH